MKLFIKRLILALSSCFILTLVILFILSLFVVVENKEMRGNSYPSFTCINTTKHPNIYKTISLDEVLDNSLLTSSEDSCGYNKAVYEWTNEKDDELEFMIDVESSGDYYIGIDYLSLNDTVIDNKISLYINDELQNSDAENMPLFSTWANESNEKVFDSNNIQVLNRQKLVKKWDYIVLREKLMLDKNPVSFSLLKGSNKIKIKKEEGEFILGDIYLVKDNELSTYNNYRKNNDYPITKNQLISLEAEKPVYKNDISILFENEQTPNTTPYNSYKNYINIVDVYFYKPGQKLTYAFEVKEAGYYNITLKYRNNFYQNINVYRNIYINDELVFDDLHGYRFPYSTKWRNETLGNKEDFLFYFPEGTNTLSIEVDASKVADSYHTLNDIVDEIGKLSLDIKKLISGVKDTNREWDLDKFLPHAKDKLNEWYNEVNQIIKDLKVINSDDGKSNEIEKKLFTVRLKLDELRKDHNKLPSKLSDLSEGSSSISQSLVLIAQMIIDTPLGIDSIYIHSPNVDLPEPNVNIFINVISAFQRIFAQKKLDQTDEDVLEIWVNRSRFYVDLMQQMADSEFTPKTGIKVKFSVMQDEGKLILANAANKQPDVALGISGWLPYELGLRGAAVNLREFEGFPELLSLFNPGSVLHMVHDDKIFGLPETQDFQVTFYRKDIFESLNLKVPETYEEVIEILPTLQRYGMNYFLPLSNPSALKPITATSPFIYQHGGMLYSEDGFRTEIDSEKAIEAITLMTELYTLYSLPRQTANFYDSFREGSIPIGVSSFDSYIKLLFAAPELVNKWDIALSPGVRQEDGTIRRDTPGTAQSVVIFEKSKKKVEGFKFLEWWLSTETQINFAHDLQLIYGEGFLWHSANIEAFRTLPINKNHIAIIEEQWQHLHEVPKVPGYYKLEREISNIWNKVVFDAESVRIAVDDAVILINREFERKLKEFDYIDSKGKKVKDYNIPTKDTIIKWMVKR